MVEFSESLRNHLLRTIVHRAIWLLWWFSFIFLSLTMEFANHFSLLGKLNLRADYEATSNHKWRLPCIHLLVFWEANLYQNKIPQSQLQQAVDHQVFFACERGYSSYNEPASNVNKHFKSRSSAQLAVVSQTYVQKTNVQQFQVY